MIINDELWQDIPLIHCYTEEMNEYSPIVIFLHGFLSAKEHNLHYAYQLVKKGIRVILPDALFHGGRSEQISEEKMNLKFWSIVVNSIQDVGKIYNEIQISIPTNESRYCGYKHGWNCHMRLFKEI